MAGQKQWYTVYEQIRRSVVVIQVRGTTYTPDKEGKLVPHPYVVQQGSGFLYSRQDKSVGIISAYHVVRHMPGDRITVFALTRGDEWIQVDNCSISLLSDEKEDVAILNFDPPGRSAEHFDTVGFPAHAFRGEMLRPGVDIVWCGYPVTLGAFVPIFQKGMVAGYSSSRYIVDGMPNPGSSGGPIFYNYNREIVGMITAHAPEPSNYKLAILHGQKNRITHIFGGLSGLGIAVPAANILRLFRRHLVGEK